MEYIRQTFFLTPVKIDVLVEEDSNISSSMIILQCFNKTVRLKEKPINTLSA